MIPLIIKSIAMNSLPFFGRHWKIIAIVAIIAGLAIYRSMLIGQIEDRDVKIVSLKEEKVELTAAIMQQNGEIEKWVNVGRAEKLKYENLRKTLKTLKKAQETELNAIMKEKKPESCEGAIQYLIDGKEDLKWE